MSVVELAPRIFKVKVPLLNNPLKTLNSYVIMAEKPLVIDTGFNLASCYIAFLKALDKIKVDFRQADYFVTHFHPDHLSLTERLTQRVYMGELDIKALQKYADVSHHERLRFFAMNGFPPEDLKRMRRHHAFKPPHNIDFQPVKDGEILEYGDYILKAILTPGHTPGHICLYNEEHGILFSGDHVLFDVTPNISYREEHDVLGDYFKSLDKIYRLSVNQMFPGHRGFHGDVKKRILEIKEHHKKRLEEIIDALREGAKTAWAIASHITWNINYKDWNALPTLQKWFIINETLAHLTHLEKKGLVAKYYENGNIYRYKLVK